MARSDTDHELGQFIPLHYHFNMLNDVARTGAFEEAIACTVKPGARVLELGGGTGVVSFFAARGAEHVWCVDVGYAFGGPLNSLRPTARLV